MTSQTLGQFEVDHFAALRMRFEEVGVDLRMISNRYGDSGFVPMPTFDWDGQINFLDHIHERFYNLDYATPYHLDYEE